VNLQKLLISLIFTLKKNQVGCHDFRLQYEKMLIVVLAPNGTRTKEESYAWNCR